ncbi:MAG: ATP-binding protein [Phycisphaerae bacterium]|nr:ATP-binding protein [Phycisphaerae bacterium]
MNNFNNEQKRKSYSSQISSSYIYEIYQDFQDYLFDHFEGSRPTMVYLYDNDKVKPCYPRVDSNKGYCGFCKIIRGDIHNKSEIKCCAKGSIDGYGTFYKSAALIGKENNQFNNAKGWKKCSFGLIEYHIPIRHKRGNDNSTLALLVVGNGRSEGDETSQKIHGYINTLKNGEKWREYFPDKNNVEWDDIAKTLHNEVDKIPIISKKQQMEIANDITDKVELIEYIASNTLQQGALYDGEKFIRTLDLGDADCSISEKSIWGKTQKALKDMIDYFELNSAAIYSSPSGDYADMKSKVVIPKGIEHSSSIMFRSRKEFESLSNKTGPLYLPHHSGIMDFDWLQSKKCFGKTHSIIFSEIFEGNNFVLIGFGYNGRKIRAFERVIFTEAISKVFEYIKSAYSRIRLDDLMSETAHLLGRTIGMINSAKNEFGKINITLENDDEEVKFQEIKDAISDGTMQMDLLKENFYSFRNNRVSRNSVHNNNESVLPAHYLDESSPEKPIMFNINESFEKLDGYFRRQAIRAKRRCEIKKTLSLDTVVYGYQEHFELVLLNLFSNAISYSYSATSIDIIVKQEGKSCVIIMSNFGTGVATDEFKTVFDPLVKSRYKDPVRKVHSLGLGLSYCRRVIQDEFKGKITLESRPRENLQRDIIEGTNHVTKLTIRIPSNPNDLE